MGLISVNTPNGIGTAYGLSEDGESVFVCHKWSDVPDAIRGKLAKCPTILLEYRKEDITIIQELY